MNIIELRMWAVERAMDLLADEEDIDAVLDAANDLMMFVLLEVVTEGMNHSGETEH